MIDFLTELDTKWFLFINGLHNQFFDIVMYTISGVKTWIPLYVILVYFIFRKLKLEGFLTLFFLIMLIIFADQGSVHIFKNTVQRLRPCHNLEIANYVHLINNECGGQFGFVSSHAANTFALAMFSALFFKNRKYSTFIFIWATVVAYSRIYLGVHYPFDVLVGAAFGLLIGFLTFHAYSFLSKKIKERKKLV